ncbi:hypothetical protein [Crenobacter luteus]|uniref:NolW-like domain-containing protein n=1 Tax=Crenobacter luteus TaxID=1452487 RepID=A0A161SL80_9NEIS|nr:hypothetical protein [Crenobacter luteus]KZE35210.1 hypothetical protein AVW16_04070 [Crenobacter luteus]
MRPSRRATLAAALIALTLGQAAQAIEVIALSWRDAQDVADALAPHLRPGETASALDDKLIVDVPPARAAELRRLVATLDVRLASLLVEVETDSRRAGGAASIDWGGRRSGSATGSGDDSGVDLRAEGRDRRTASRQTLRLLDNRSGYIAIGDSRPMPWRLYGPHGPVGGVEYRDAIRGFHVRPRLIGGDRVRVDIATRDDAFRGRSQERARLATTVEGRLGEWILLGGVGAARDGSAVALFGAGATHERLERAFRLRVTRQP